MTVGEVARTWRPVAGTVVAVALVALAGLGLYVHAFDRSPWQAVPSEITACGRDYVDPARSQPQTLKFANETAGFALEKVGSTSGWIRTREIWGRQDTANPGDRCGTLVWLRADSSHFVEYSLSGGP